MQTIDDTNFEAQIWELKDSWVLSGFVCNVLKFGVITLVVAKVVKLVKAWKPNCVNKDFFFSKCKVNLGS
jgi:hypothetical protein